MKLYSCCRDLRLCALKGMMLSASLRCLALSVLGCQAEV